MQTVSLNAKTEITGEEVLRIETAAPCVIHAEVTIFPPFGSGERVRPPDAYIPFRVRVPLGTGLLLHGVLHLLTGVGRGAGESDRTQSEYCAQA